MVVKPIRSLFRLESETEKIRKFNTNVNHLFQFSRVEFIVLTYIILSVSIKCLCNLSVQKIKQLNIYMFAKQD